jgi:hypothetical protein
MNSIEQGGVREILKKFNSLRALVVLEIVEAGELNPATAIILKERINALVDDFLPRLQEELTAGQRKTFVKGIQLVDSVVGGAGLTVAVPFLGETILSQVQQFGAELITNITDAARHAIAQELSISMLGQKPQIDTLKEIGRSLKIGGGKQPQSVFGKVAKRAEVIFRTEVNRIGNLASVERLQQVEQTGAVPDLRKQWLHSHVGIPRPGHLDLDNVVVGVNEKFRLLGVEGDVFLIEAPHDPILPAQEVVNCKCAAVPFVERFA